MGDFGTGEGADNGLGSLADELADGWDEDGDEYEGEASDEELVEGAEEDFGQANGSADQTQPDFEVTRDSGIDVSSSPPATTPVAGAKSQLVPPKDTLRTRHRRSQSDYDGSDYGDESDLESPGMPPALEARIAQIESLARRGTETNGSNMDGVVERVVNELRDLGGQASVEGGATRYVSRKFPSHTHLLTTAFPGPFPPYVLILG